MKIKTNVKAGNTKLNHNQTILRGLKVRTNLRAGHAPPADRNHNQTVARDLTVKTDSQNVPFFARKLAGQAIVVKTGVKAGASEQMQKKQ